MKLELPQEIREMLSAWVVEGRVFGFDFHALTEIISDAYELGIEDGREDAMATVGDWYQPRAPERGDER